MKLLVIGSGGREHALAWRLAAPPRVHKVYVAPGNGGTQRAEQMENIALTNAEELADFVQREGIALTVVGPEAPLAAGVVDVFRARGLKIFGPTKAAAQLESSKDYAKAFMVRHNIPTARYETFTDPARAHAYIDAEGAPSSSRPTAWPPARAWWWLRRWKRPTRRSTPCWATAPWARPARAS